MKVTATSPESDQAPRGSDGRERTEPMSRTEFMRLQRRARRPHRSRLSRWSAATILFAIIVVAAALYLAGFRTYAITGGSMEGTIGKGALIIDRIVPVRALAAGDIITYRPPGRSDLVTHRIISIDAETAARTLFRTQGDANETADPWLFTLDSDRQARYVFQVPYLGYVLLIFGTPLIRSLLLGTLALLLTLSIFLQLWREAGQHSEPTLEGSGASSVSVASEWAEDRSARRSLRAVDRRR